MDDFVSGSDRHYSRIGAAFDLRNVIRIGRDTLLGVACQFRFAGRTLVDTVIGGKQDGVSESKGHQHGCRRLLRLFMLFYRLLIGFPESMRCKRNGIL